MKIGILTFHSQLNYGGVLQCWALQTALEKLGHEVVVIDRWILNDNYMLEKGYDAFGCKQWIWFWIRSVLGLGDISQWLRVRRTKKFLRQHIKRTPYHFVDWREAPKDLGVDMLVVGSDQVWHCGDWGDPRVYLLDGAAEIPAVAYAASFGMTAIPHYISTAENEIEARPLYERGLARFKAVSCREAEGVRLCEECGVSAEHVVDPTLLLDRDEWSPVSGHSGRCPKKAPCLVCYFLSENIVEALPVLEAFAQKNKCKIKVLLDYGKIAPLPFPVNLAKLKIWAKANWKRLFGRVSVCVSAGPKEFVKAFADATWVVSDSFHALMFSIIFGKDVRMLRPASEKRQKMFARIEEIAAHAKGPLVSEGLEAALRSIESGEGVMIDGNWIAMFRERSIDWLKKSL